MVQIAFQRTPTGRTVSEDTTPEQVQGLENVLAYLFPPPTEPRLEQLPDGRIYEELLFLPYGRKLHRAKRWRFDGGLTEAGSACGQIWSGSWFRRIELIETLPPGTCRVCFPMGISAAIEGDSEAFEQTRLA